MLLTALLLTATADVLPPGHKEIECYHRVVGLDTVPGVRWGLYPEGPSFDGLAWLDVEEGVLEFHFYAASPPYLWAVPEGVAAQVDADVLEGPGEDCEARCEETPEALGCAQCGASEEEYMAALGLARTSERLDPCDSVPQESPLVSLVLQHTLEGTEGVTLKSTLELVQRTEADLMAEKQAERAEREAERAALQAAERDENRRRGLQLVGLSLLLVAVGWALRRQVARLEGR
ncbi:MAG: hypothetical protein H6741_14655 [Alphaproteobacteria bacterium]|nr:hypothetical protein [Alphaproteobacteria bacterium]MCB9793958.1 hypothetical protein [Alphaproteobacteria bacterium]